MSARRAIPLVLFLLCSISHAMQLGCADGVAMIDGTPVPLRFSYAKLAPSIRPGAAEDILVLLTDRPLPASALTNESEMARLIKRGETKVVEVRLDERYQHVRTVLHGKKPATLSGKSVDVKPTYSSRRLIDVKINDAGGAGSVNVKIRSLIGDANVFAPNAPAEAALDAPPMAREQTKQAIRRHLDAPNPVVIPGGTPLPPDGGEPARVYRAYHEALRKNDVETVKRLLVTERVSELELMKQLKVPLSSIARTRIEVVSGWVQGDWAIVNVTGTRIELRARSSGVVTMLKKDGAWRIGREQWHASADDVVATYSNMNRSKVPALTTGSPLPANGGEAGDVWRSYDRAFAQGDFEAVKNLVRREDAAEMDLHPNGAFGLREYRPTNVRVVGGVTAGSKATLNLEGTPAFPTTSPVGTVTLVKEDGVWRIGGGEDWSPPVDP